MTDKKERILDAALTLFAREGYAATPTSKIAKVAGVSEGLIFRHFENKQGLLDALMQKVELKLAGIYGPVLMETDPRLALKKCIELPFLVPESEFDFWRLQFMLKWQKEYNHPEKMQALIDKLTQVFRELDHENPEGEAMLVNLILEAVATSILKGNMSQDDEIRYFLLGKYGL
jgi:AcrR family transcriptional regulator